MIPSLANLHNMYWDPKPSNFKKEEVKRVDRLRPLLSKHTSLIEKKMKD